MFQNLGNAPIAANREKVIAINNYLRKKRAVQINNLRFHLEIISIRKVKPKIGRRKEIIQSKIKEIKSKRNHGDKKLILLKD